MDHRLEQALRELRDRETGPGRASKEALVRTALLYPSPYHVAMSSLGYLQIFRLLNARPGSSAERAMLPPRDALDRHRQTRTPLLTVETQRPTTEFQVLAISHAYELELTGIVQVLELSGVEPLAKDRTAADPLVVVGGPITFSNPLPTGVFADVLILGEAEGAIHQLYDRLEASPEAARGSEPARRRLLEELAALPGFFIPSLHGEDLPPIAQADDALLPAYSEIQSPDTELANMMLIEPERGCHRGCTFCVMRRSTNGGMRLVPPSLISQLVPDEVKKVGLVGAAVTDHPRIAEILRDLIDVRGKRIGISSLRADRLDDELVGLLARGGYRSMTVALDAASERLRHSIEKNLPNRHVMRAAELAKAHGMRHLKLYLIVGLPDETRDDLIELTDFALELRRTLPVVLGISPFVPKFHTPLADSPFMGEAGAEASLRFLRSKLAGKVQMRGPGPREAWVEYRLAQGGFAHGEAAIAAARGGATLSAWKRALSALPERVRPPRFQDLMPAATLRRAPRALRLAPSAAG